MARGERQLHKNASSVQRCGTPQQCESSEIRGDVQAIRIDARICVPQVKKVQKPRYGPRGAQTVVGR